VYAVIERDGSLNERTPVALRH